MIYMSIYPRFQVLSTDQKQLDNLCYTETVRFPEEIYLINASDRPKYGNLYIGNYQAALNIELLKLNNVNAVLSVAKGYKIDFPKESIRYNKYIPLDEHSYKGYYNYILDSIQYLEEKLLLTNVIIHCVSGLKRSAWIAIAYLIKNKRLSLEEALKYVKNKVKMMKIDGQVLQILKKYEIDLQNKSPRKNKFNNSIRAKGNNSIVMSKEQFVHQNHFESLLTEINHTKHLNLTDNSQLKIKSQMLNISKPTISNRQMSHLALNPEKNYSIGTKKSQSVGHIQQNTCKLYQEKDRNDHTKRSKSNINKNHLTLKTIKKVQTIEELNLTLTQLKTQLQKSRTFGVNKIKNKNK